MDKGMIAPGTGVTGYGDWEVMKGDNLYKIAEQIRNIVKKLKNSERFRPLDKYI